MEYSLSKALKERGFKAKCTHTIAFCPDNDPNHDYSKCDEVIEPQLEELVDACKDKIAMIGVIKCIPGPDKWYVADWSEQVVDACHDLECCEDSSVGDTLKEAMARFWLLHYGNDKAKTRSEESN